MKNWMLSTAFAACLLAPALPHAQAPGPSFMLGSPAETGHAERAIALTGETRWVNVKSGETVRFTVGNQAFAWKFDGPATWPFDLREVAPAGLLTQPIKVYVERRFHHL